MLSSLLEQRFQNCDGLRIQKYGKRTQTVRLACIHCQRCTGELVARKSAESGQSILSTCVKDVSFVWRWCFSEVLREPALQQPASAAALQLPPVFPIHLTIAPSFPPPPSTPVTPVVVIGHYDSVTGSNIPVQLPRAPAPLEPLEVPITSAPLPPAPAPLAPLQEPVEADTDEVPLTPAPSLALEVPVISTNDW